MRIAGGSAGYVRRGPAHEIANAILADRPDGAVVWVGGKEFRKRVLPHSMFRGYYLFFCPYSGDLIVGKGSRYRSIDAGKADDNGEGLGVRHQLTLAVMMGKPDRLHYAEEIANLGYDEHGYEGGDPEDLAAHRIFRIRRAIQPGSAQGPFVYTRRYVDVKGKRMRLAYYMSSKDATLILVEHAPAREKGVGDDRPAPATTREPD